MYTIAKKATIGGKGLIISQSSYWYFMIIIIALIQHDMYMQWILLTLFAEYNHTNKVDQQTQVDMSIIDETLEIAELHVD